MRILLGIILGFFLTVGVAYVHDASINPPTAGSVAVERPMVNWDVVSIDWQDLRARVSMGWHKLQSISFG